MRFLIWFRILLIALVICLLNFPTSTLAEDGSIDESAKWIQPTWQKPHLEWATLAVGGATHGAAFEGMFFGFRMPHLSVTILDFSFGFGMPERTFEQEDDYRTVRYLFAWGSNIAYPLVLDNAKRHELRFGLTPEFHFNFHGAYDLPGECSSGEWLCSPGYGDSMVGLALAPRIAYSYRITEVVSLRVALTAHISVAGEHTCGLFCEAVDGEYPWPGVFLTVGFRFGTPWDGLSSEQPINTMRDE